MNAGALRRELGLVGAVTLGLGSILGTGVFVSLGLVAGLAGSWVLVAIAAAAALATCNGLSSAQLAASHPVSGGAYEYGRRYLTPSIGFLAGSAFLIAKSASAATAALGFAGYGLRLVGLEAERAVLPLALGAVLLLTVLAAGGLKRSHVANLAIVSVTFVALLAFVVIGLPRALDGGTETVTASVAPSAAEWLEACALAFVAYTGYGRVATMGEEIRDPRRSIPKAIIATLIASSLLYLGVAWVGTSALGAEGFEREASAAAPAPLEAAARALGSPRVAGLVALGAVTAMLGVLLNLILGLSRVALAMGRNGDLPRALGGLDGGGHPRAAVLAVGAFVALLALIGDVRLTWSLSAFTVLVYYAVTNLSALRLPREQRLYPSFIAVLGLGGCLFLAFWVERSIWLWGAGVLLALLILRAVLGRFR